jgi:hypothetical protein
MAVRREMRGLMSEKRSEINLEKIWLLVELFNNGVLLGSTTEA